MAWTSGTAAGHDDLMDDLKTFLTTNAALVAAGQNWVAEKDETFTPRTIFNVAHSGLTGNMRALYLNGPGLCGTREYSCKYSPISMDRQLSKLGRDWCYRF
jgi:hypothetical protein